MLLLEILMTISFMLFLPFYFVERVLHKKSHGWKEKFGGGVNDWAGNATTSSKSKVIMLHGCSVGEALALENLLKSIKLLLRLLPMRDKKLRKKNTLKLQTL